MKNKTVRAILLIFVVMLIIMSINIKSLAEQKDISNTNKTASITVSNVEAGVKISEYKLLTVNYNYEANQPADPEYAWDENVKTWLETNYPDYTNPESFKKAVDSNTIDAKVFYDEMTKAIKNGTIELQPVQTAELQGNNTYPITSENLTGSKTFENLDMGTYLTVIENGYMVYMPSVVNLAPEFDNQNNKWVLNDATVQIKSSNMGIVKTVTDEIKNTDTVGLTDTLNYTILSDVPDYLQNSLSKIYKISDKYDNTIVLNKSSIKVTGISTTNKALELNNEYTVEFDDTNCSFEISFDYGKISQYNKIKVEYNAKLNKNAVIGNIGNNNTAKLTYSNNPYVSGSTINQESTAKVYSYQIDITKKDQLTDANLSGAQFILVDKQGNSIYFVQDENNAGMYYLSTSQEQNATTTLVTNSSGKISLIGLNVREYELKETKAPNGYTLQNKKVTINIKDENKDGLIDDLNSGVYSILVKNSKGFLLPLTGGKGTTIFVIIGLILIIAGAVLLIKGIKRK